MTNIIGNPTSQEVKVNVFRTDAPSLRMEPGLGNAVTVEPLPKQGETSKDCLIKNSELGFAEFSIEGEHGIKQPKWLLTRTCLKCVGCQLKNAISPELLNSLKEKINEGELNLTKSRGYDFQDR